MGFKKGIFLRVFSLIAEWAGWDFFLIYEKHSFDDEEQKIPFAHQRKKLQIIAINISKHEHPCTTHNDDDDAGNLVCKVSLIHFSDMSKT